MTTGMIMDTHMNTWSIQASELHNIWIVFKLIVVEYRCLTLLNFMASNAMDVLFIIR